MNKLFKVVNLLCLGILISQAQNVGVGTTNPQARLDIVAPSSFSQPLLRVQLDGAAYPQFSVLPDGRLGIGTFPPDNSSVLEISDTTRGVLLPRLSVNQRNSIPNPATGLLVYQTDGSFEGFWFYDGANWRYILTDRELTWKHSNDSLFSLPDTALIIRGVGTPMPGYPATTRQLIFKSRDGAEYIVIQPRDYVASPHRSGISFIGSSNTTTQYIAFAPEGGYSGAIFYNSPNAPKGFSIVTDQYSRVIIDSSGLVGMRWKPNPPAWANLPENKQPTLWVSGRIVQNYNGIPTENTLLPWGNTCSIYHHDTTVDIGDTLKFWLQRCRSVTLVLDSGKLYTWNTRVRLQPFQNLFIFCPIHVAIGTSADSNNYDCKIQITQKETFQYQSNLYREPAKLVVGHNARFKLWGVKIYDKAPLNLPITRRSPFAGLFTTTDANSDIRIYMSAIYTYEHFINIAGGAWSTIAIVTAYIINKNPSNVINPVAVYDGWDIDGNGGVVLRHPTIFLGPGVQWDNSGALIYRD
ncbi:MAG: hypothetical protein GXO48_02825 [Chlorobi bacterium]|nr:hypothetical protein [Chlorobiota bacterium]